MNAAKALLAFDPPAVGARVKLERPPRPPMLKKPSASRQGKRISPQFQNLQHAFENSRVSVTDGAVDEVDPELVVVFDLAGTVDGFRSAAEAAGLEFLTEQLDESLDPNEDFHYIDNDTGGESPSVVVHSLYAVMTNATAIDELIRLFDSWVANPGLKFQHGLGKFKTLFAQLRAVRRWEAVDRVRDTGLLDQWRDRIALVGGSYSPEIIEVELWYRSTSAERFKAEVELKQIVSDANGEVLASAQIGEIAYHALLVELPVQQVEQILEKGASSVRLLNADQIMFVSPYQTMSVHPDGSGPANLVPNLPGQSPGDERPRVALFDGLPFGNHDQLQGRLIIDDPDDLAGGGRYPMNERRHGTSMASLIIHGDLTERGTPMSRPLYCRPILEPEAASLGERFVRNALLPDLIHRAVRRLFDGENGRDPVAPSVRLINLSIGSSARALVRRISPTGRLLDWLAVKYNVLFVVSAGNHLDIPIKIPQSAVLDTKEAKAAAIRSARDTSRVRGIMPPGDGLNVLTVGASHSDSSNIALPGTVWDVTGLGAPALYGAVGPGVRGSVKPDVHHTGGRAVYVKPVAGLTSDVTLQHAPVAGTGPGTLSAAPGRSGETNNVEYSHGTSNATALVTREANRIFDVLESLPDQDSLPLPDAQYHPVLARALIVHAASWSQEADRLQDVLQFAPATKRKHLTALLGYGALRTDKIAAGSGNRAVIVAAGHIRKDERHTYSVPFPVSLRAKAEWHRVTVTLAAMVPTAGDLAKYRASKVFFRSLYDDVPAVGQRAEAYHHAVRRGSCQHEMFESDKPLVFGQGDTIPIHIECQNDARNMLAAQTVRYSLVVSIETAAAVSTTIHDEVRAGLRAYATLDVRNKVQVR